MSARDFALAALAGVWLCLTGLCIATACQLAAL